MRYLPGARRVDPPCPGTNLHDWIESHAWPGGTGAMHMPARLHRVGRRTPSSDAHIRMRVQWHGWCAYRHGMAGARTVMAWLVRVPSWHGWCAYRHGMAGARTVMAWLVRVPSWHGWCAYRHGMAGARTVMACAATGARDPCLPSAAPQRSPCSGFRLSCRSSRSPRCEAVPDRPQTP